MKAADWKEVHGELTRLARLKGAYDAEEARWLLEGKRVRVHEPLGFATYLEYLERILGYGPRLAMERLRVAEALLRLPGLRDALAANDLSWSAVRELSRVAVPATEAEWIACATGRPCARSRRWSRAGEPAIGQAIYPIRARPGTFHASRSRAMPWPPSEKRAESSSSTSATPSTTTPRSACSPTRLSATRAIRAELPTRSR
jgi:hypothetical protein